MRALPTFGRIALAIVIAVMAIPGEAVTSEQNAPEGFASVTQGRFAGGDGKLLFLVGTNYEGFPDRSWKMWDDGMFQSALIDRDFAKAKRAGVKVLRIFVQRSLVSDISAGKWDKLDAVVGLARKHGLLLSITFYDYSESDLAKVANIDRRIAQRYAGEPAVLGYGLKNEPHYQDIATPLYPPGTSVPLQTDALIRQYGERVSEQASAAWRLTDEGKAHIPARFSAREAYIYSNNYRIYREFLDAAGKWVAARNYDVSVLDYVDSPDSARWTKLLEAINGSLRAWIAVQRDAVRAVDPNHLITVGYSDMVLAKLGANKVLDYQSVHRYPGGSLRELGLFFNVMQNVKKAFPSHPIVLEEFGYSNASLGGEASSIYETAIYLRLWKDGFAGGLKWMLNDLASGWDRVQMKYGMYTSDEGPKPVVSAMGALSGYLREPRGEPGDLRLEADPSSGIRYAYSSSNALFVAGKSYADSRLRFQSSVPAQVFVSWKSPTTVLVQTTAAANVQINPSALVGDGGLQDKYALERLDGDARTPQGMDVSSGWVGFPAEAGKVYAIRLLARSVDAKIQIVWPIGNKPVSQASKANIGAYLFAHGSSASVCPDPNLKVELWRALNNGVEELVGPGRMALRATAGGSAPSWEFNDVDVSAANDPVNKYYFRVGLAGAAGASGNVWSHGEDARTHFPQQDVPAGVLATPPTDVDAKIEIVWPQGNLPVSKATRANVGVFLFQRGTLQSVPLGWNPTVRLWRSLNTNPAESVATGRAETRTVGGVTFPVWSFDNVDVSPATDPSNKLYFRATVDGVSSRGNIWSHAVDARTYFPKQDSPVPPDGC